MVCHAHASGGGLSKGIVGLLAHTRQPCYRIPRHGIAVRHRRPGSAHGVLRRAVGCCSRRTPSEVRDERPGYVTYDGSKEVKHDGSGP